MYCSCIIAMYCCCCNTRSCSGVKLAAGSGTSALFFLFFFLSLVSAASPEEPGGAFGPGVTGLGIAAGPYGDGSPYGDPGSNPAATSGFATAGPTRGSMASALAGTLADFFSLALGAGSAGFSTALTLNLHSVLGASLSAACRAANKVAMGITFSVDPASATAAGGAWATSLLRLPFPPLFPPLLPLPSPLLFLGFADSSGLAFGAATSVPFTTHFPDPLCMSTSQRSW
mmetsp:Transcript_28174/g.62150  ORF Transcript_28174/g.62150 Transcript_28174/m.62150 type:complete len:229 (+) Transcript_28174:1174-1860(+)